LQPGVFALSGWDLHGSLPLHADEVGSLIRDGDTRWINRGAYDLMGYSPEAEQSLAGLPRAKDLYGGLPAQLRDKTSFARRLQRILSVRAEYNLATAHQLDIASSADPAVLVLVHQLSE